MIKLILQFLIENNLHRTAHTLQEETDVSLNIVNDINQLTSDICDGKWNEVLNALSSVSISRETEYDLFEQIIRELIQMSEIDCARRLLFESEPMERMKQANKSRYELLLQSLTNRNTTDIDQQLHWQQRREEIAHSVRRQVLEVQPSRLLAVISQSLKYQQLSGNLFVPKKKRNNMQNNSKYNLLQMCATNHHKNSIKGMNDRNNANTNESKVENVIRYNSCIIPFESGSNINHCCSALEFSPDGQWLVTGSDDGYIEFWDFEDGSLRTNLLSARNARTPAMEEIDDESPLLLMHSENESVSCIAFTHDSQLMSTANERGSLKIWKLYPKPKNVCTFETAHSNRISSLQFSNDGSQILSSSLDCICRIHGLKSRRLLKEFKGHASFVNQAIYSLDNQIIISASKDGTLKIWDKKTQNCLFTLSNLNAMTVMKKNAMQEYLNNAYGNAATDTNADIAPSANMSDIQSCAIIGLKLNVSSKRKAREEVFVITANDVSTVFLLNYKTGKIVNKFKSLKIERFAEKQAQKKKQNKKIINNDGLFCMPSLVDLAMSRLCTYAYTVSEPNHFLYCLNLQKQENKNKNENKMDDILVNAIKIHDQSILHIAHHPHRNILASVSTDRTVKIWIA